MMKEQRASNIWLYLGRFSFLYLLVYILVAFPFVNIQPLIPEASRIALDYFKPYSLGLTDLIIELLRGLIMALVLYPFYNLFVNSRRGLAVLFAALWGLAFLGSLEPRPGSFEGLIYLDIDLIEHLLVMFVSAIQIALFALFFLRWERSVSFDREGQSLVRAELQCGAMLKGKVAAYLVRFTLLHMLVYIIIGLVFYQVSGYEDALATMEEFTLWRNLESLSSVAIVFFGQITRGAVIGLLLLPFYDTFMQAQRGWLLLFGLLFGLMVLVAVVFIPTNLAELEDLKVGIPEITAQTLVFSLLYFTWERRRILRQCPTG